MRCSPNGVFTTVDTGTDDEGTSSAIRIDDGLAAQSVEIRNVDGFTGSFWKDVGQSAEVTMKGRTYLLDGTAMGFVGEDPSRRVERPFSIKASC